MKAVSGKRFCTILEAKGWQLKRVNGSHHIYTNADGSVALKADCNEYLMRLAEIHESDL